MKPEDMQWLIWSLEHGAYWKPRREGYTRERVHAGRYSFEEASEIVQQANSHITTDLPNEAICPDWYRKTSNHQ
jgi:hypothetical protein